MWLLLISSVGANSLALLDGDILFDKDERALTAQGKKSLDTLVNTLHGFDGILSIRIIAHTDDQGEANANTALSQRRADWIAGHFKKHFPGIHIISLGAGGSIPRASNLSAAGRAHNRRVQVQAIASGNPSKNQ